MGADLGSHCSLQCPRSACNWIVGRKGHVWGRGQVDSGDSLNHWKEFVVAYNSLYSLVSC